MSDSVFLETRFQILSGGYVAGTQLDREAFAAVYDCNPRLILDAFNALIVEGYLEKPNRGMFVVKEWDRNEVNDSYDLWAHVATTSAARTAERADLDDINYLAGIIGPGDSYDFADELATERYLQDYVLFTVELVRFSKTKTLTAMAKQLAPNFLFRKALWCSTADDLHTEREALEHIAQDIRDRSAARVKDRIYEVVMRTVKAWPGDRIANVNSAVEVVRPTFPVMIGDVSFGLGDREPTLDGIVVPYGITPNG
ncbi:MAG: hypothetical protein E6Q06_00775 [Candidatus Moraniibacteriota bacterium]|nr:MAG: hypothetical protein E6Q06_00775 [Candidatus Moranbacteria bacterium]